MQQIFLQLIAVALIGIFSILLYVTIKRMPRRESNKDLLYRIRGDMENFDFMRINFDTTTAEILRRIKAIEKELKIKK